MGNVLTVRQLLSDQMLSRRILNSEAADTKLYSFAQTHYQMTRSDSSHTKFTGKYQSAVLSTVSSALEENAPIGSDSDFSAQEEIVTAAGPTISQPPDASAISPRSTQSLQTRYLEPQRCQGTFLCPNAAPRTNTTLRVWADSFIERIPSLQASP